MTQLWRSFGYLVPLALVGGTLVGGTVLVVSWARSRFERSRRAVGVALGDALLVVWALCFVALTLWSRDPGERAWVQLVPLADLRGYAHAVSWQVPVTQVGGNLVFYGAIGVLLAARFRWGVGRTVVVGAAVAVLDEALQWLLPTGRSVTTDDVLVAAVGVAAGAGLVVLARIVGRRLAGDRLVAATATASAEHGPVRRPGRTPEPGSGHDAGSAAAVPGNVS